MKRAISPRLGLLLLASTLSACAYNPSPVFDPPPGDLQLSEARTDVNNYLGTPVRWGGTIVNVETTENETAIEVAERELGRYGEPTRRRPSEGRFVATVSEALDPVTYDVGRDITVAGTLAGVSEGVLGRERQALPRVEVSEHRLWARPVRYRYYPRYRYYDPFYYPHGYFRYRHHGHHHGRHRRHW